MENNSITPQGIDPSRVLLTGATGYVGRRLLPRLEARGLSVRCLARDPAKLQGKSAETTEIVPGDVLDRDSLVAALDGVEIAYYLVHLMASSSRFEQQDREAAENFASAAKATGLRRIIYLGGLGDDSDPTLSPHLRSRHEVGEIFRRSGVEVIEFRASVVVGSGSLSFDLIQSLTNRLPVMICPRWLATPTQPIAIEDMLQYLTAAIDLPPSASRIFEVGGSEIVTYGKLIQEYARQRGLRRWLISVPILTPRLSSLWLGLVTPASAEVGRHLIEGLRNPTVVRNPDALQVFTQRPMGIEQAIREALQQSDTAV
ncbi:NAD(P)H-binding protein [Blastopirellula sp. J2-11]|uniref:NAD(P)H-binding protein n=1 Tax=Blastopirellula sp. J2-11 TaxID=2943192 RepID=UPI0021C7A546|nr:NAD(P)H-binding protein [Blastopirellula sp. J2-11]UUO06148.1 NAD(P)H-binding protein [Blastopirellula sp. J2-11]